MYQDEYKTNNLSINSSGAQLVKDYIGSSEEMFFHLIQSIATFGSLLVNVP